MSFLSGKRPFLLVVPLLLTRCVDQSVPAGTVETTGEEGAESTAGTMTPTTGLVEPEPTETGNDLTETGSESSSSSGEDEQPGSSSSTGSTDAGPPICGDGVLDAGEECDEGFGKNTANGACLPNCVSASCGDGVVHAGTEDCDLGAENGFGYGGCNELTCKWGPRCGDGQVDTPHEVCDPGDPNRRGEGVAVCDDSCRFAGRIVFLSSVKFDGNLGGVAGADKLCRDLAATFDEAHADSYRAWLSDAENSPQTRFAHGPEFNGVPYVLRNGVEVAGDFTDLVTHGPLPGINLTETNEFLALRPVWTNTGVDGFPLTEDEHCDGWTANLFQTGRRGINAVPAESLDEWKTFGQWTTVDGTVCLTQLHLYCFEN